MYIISALVAVVLIGALFVVHVGLHKENDCHMTFMWRHISLVPFNVDGNNVRTYKLVRYIEGFVNEKTLARSPTDIPVLFIPGSGGSANQVRSVASIMMNKTEMKSAPFRMHFYAIDFNEELSFLSGSTVIRQRDFVMKAITRVQRMYTRKIILIGHSFGGTVVHALPAAAGFDVSQLGLIITLAAPLVAPPILMDETMVAFYESMNSSWISRREELRHVGLVSYSGGSKDFQVPDHLAAFPGSHVVHRPSWSIRGVDTAADHLCILWCNQLTRHSTRVLYNYGMEQMKNSKPRSPRAVVKEFFRQERISSERKSKEQTDDAELNFDESSMVGSSVKIGLFDYPWVSRTYRGTLEESQKTFELQFPSPYSVYSVSLNSSCGATLLFTYTDSISRASVQRGDNQVMVIDRPYFLNITAGKIVMKGKPNCEYDLSVRPDVFHAWYLVLISNAQLFLHVSFSVCMILAVIEKLRGSESKGFRIQSGFYSNGATLCTVFFCFTYNVWILECIFAATLFYLLFLINILSTIFVLAKDLVHSSAPFVVHLSCLSINLVVLFLLTFNIHLANAAVAVFMIVRRSSGPYAVTLSIWVAVICIALAVYSHNGMDDYSDYDDEQAESPLSSQSGICSLDGVLDDHKRHARAQHNALERRRRDNIKDMYTNLKDAVPDMQNERASRAAILRRAIEVIEEKQQQRADLEADCDRLRNETAELEMEIKRMRESLNKTGEPNLYDLVKSHSNLLGAESPRSSLAYSPMKSDSNKAAIYIKDEPMN